MKSISPHLKWIIPAILAILLIGYLTYRATQKPISFTLTTGEQVEVFYLKYANKHTIEDLAFTTKIRDKLPKAWQKPLMKILPDDPLRYTSISFWESNPDKKTLLVALIKPDRPDFKSDLLCILSDHNGWYNAGVTYGNENIPSRIVSMPPRDSHQFLLSIYQRESNETSPTPLGKVQIPNPAYLNHLPAGHPIPQSVTTDTAQISISGFYTGISLPELTTNNRYRFPIESVSNPPPSLAKAINGLVKSATLPETPWTVLVFKPAFKNGKDLNSLRNVTLKFSDSLNGFQDRTHGYLFKTTDTCSLIWQENLPVNNGDYTFELTLLEDPDGNAPWLSTKPITPGINDRDSTQVLYLGSKKIEIGMTTSNTLVNFATTKEDPTLWALKANLHETSEPLKISPIARTYSYRDPQQSTAQITPPVTSGTVIISIAKAIERKLTFKGVPTRPK